MSGHTTLDCGVVSDIPPNPFETHRHHTGLLVLCNLVKIQYLDQQYLFLEQVSSIRCARSENIKPGRVLYIFLNEI